jgi:hypothetical protein
LAAYEPGGKLRETVLAPPGIGTFDDEVSSFDATPFAQALHERIRERARKGGRMQMRATLPAGCVCAASVGANAVSATLERNVRRSIVESLRRVSVASRSTVSRFFIE